jgi:BirA family biotin operon repressor/biotin-[acetyl-CoA-carboxylase] ligase
MTLPLASAVASRLEFLEECGSTNTELVRRAADAWPHFSVVATASQTAGRGRLDRVWVAPPGQTLAVSVLLRPTFALGSYGWLPLIAGLAMARAVDALVQSSVTIKWPNDVQVNGLKVSGLLAELLPTADGVVIGAGLNLAIPADSLPTANSTSLNLHGAEPALDEVLAAYLRELSQLYSTFDAGAGDAEASGIRQLVQQRCSTIGQQVRVELPGGKTRFGVATGIDAEGRLVYTDRADGSVQAVAAGDVTHLRYE